MRNAMEECGGAPAETSEAERVREKQLRKMRFLRFLSFEIQNKTLYKDLKVLTAF